MQDAKYRMQNKGSDFILHLFRVQKIKRRVAELSTRLFILNVEIFSWF
jgi:hypothetical protein